MSARRRDKERYQRDPEKFKKRAEKWRAANAERKRATRKAEYERDREKAKQNAREWHRTHPEHAAETKRKRRAENREAILEAERLKNNRRRGAPGQYTAEDIRRIFNSQNGCCYYCEKPLVRYHIEHKTPIARGGTNDPENIAVACAACNLRKGPRTEEEFREVMRVA